MIKEIRAFNFEVRAENDEQHGSILTGSPIVFGERTDLGWCDEIIDDGAGIAPEKVVSILRGDAYKNKKDGSVGIYNVNTRLIHCFGNEYGLNITSPGRPGQGTRVTIRVPIISDADFS